MKFLKIVGVLADTPKGKIYASFFIPQDKIHHVMEYEDSKIDVFFDEGKDYLSFSEVEKKILNVSVIS